MTETCADNCAACYENLVDDLCDLYGHCFCIGYADDGPNGCCECGEVDDE